MMRKDEDERSREQKAHEDNVKYLKDLNAEVKGELSDLLGMPEDDKGKKR
jgi:hypothetical protein